MTTPSGQPPNHDPGQRPDPSGWPPQNQPHQPDTGPQPTQGYPGPGYDQPRFDQPRFDQPEYGQPPPGYQQPPQPYGQPGYAAPGYGTGGYADPSAPYGYDMAGRPYSDKQKLVAGLLGIFLGAFGVGRFYTGHTGLGVAQLVVGIFTCFTVSSIWGLIDGILILVNGGTDSEGRPLRD